MSTQKLSITTELMKNFKQSELMSPEQKFEALQTQTGSSLLFSIGTDHVFYVTQEKVGHDTGWTKTDLSTAQIGKSFAGQTGLTCKTFEAAQSAVDGSVGLAMVISDATSDHLFLCLGNSNTDTSWVANPTWVHYPFDNPTKNVTIVNVLLSETVNQTQYIVADILRDPASVEKLISRYYINTKEAPAWQPHDVAIDLEANSYSSCLGRQYLPHSPRQPTIDGLYTLGQVDGLAQFTFQPLYNVFDPTTPALSARLQLPGNLVADAMASCRNANVSTDLYVCSKGGLYYFASANQNDGAVAILLAQNTMFVGVKKMYAYQSHNVVTVWGLNGNNQIFYTNCAVGQETASPSVWSFPIPIVSGVDLFSPYINRVDGGNTFFAVADNTLKKSIKSAEDSTWAVQNITLPSLDKKDTQKYSSYTTRILVTDENNQPLVNVPVSISAGARAGVYINHLYYVLDTIGITIQSDQFGTITIVEWITDLTGTLLNISLPGQNATQLNPMTAAFTKLSQLNTADSLKNANIKSDDGSTRPLISSSISDDELKTVATANSNLGTLYTTLPTSVEKRLLLGGAIPLTPARTIQLGDFDAFILDAGDFFSWLASGVEAVIDIVSHSDIWHFVATIAGEAYACILDIKEKVVGAIMWVYNKVKTAIEDIIQFLEFLFAWQDILNTHKVMKNAFIQFTQHSINGLSDFKSDIQSVFQAIQHDIDKWADIPDFDQTSGSTAASNPALSGQNSAPANLGNHHYQGNAANSSSSFTPSPVTGSVFDDLMNLLNSEEATLMGACNAIKTDILDQFSSLTVTQIIKKFIAIVVDTLLQSVENVLVAVVDVFIHLVDGLMEILTATLEIPVLSWLYEEITGEPLSFLDLICLIGAIPATIIYKIGAGTAPFPKGDAFTNGLMNAGSFEEMRGLFFTKPAASNTLLASNELMAGDEPVLDESRLKTFGFAAGMLAAGGSIVLVITSTIQRVLEIAGEDAAFAKLALISAIGNVAYVSPNIATIINAKTDNWYQQMNNVLTGISIIKGFVNIPLTKFSSEDPKSKISPAIETFINVVWNIPVIMNIVDNKDRWNTNYKSLIPETIGNFAFNFGGILEFPYALAKDPATKVEISVAQYAFMLVYGAFMPIAGGIYSWAPDQTHS